MGLSLVSLGVIALFILIELYDLMLKPEEFDTTLQGFAKKWQLQFENADAMFESTAGYGLGGSSIALFGRVGGGIYTKAADVGADLLGKNEYGLEEDDKRNPACTAGNVGDNVGDIAGMGADLFGSFAEATCVALVLAASSNDLQSSWKTLMYPVLISSLEIVVGIVTLTLRNVIYRVHDEFGAVEKALKGILTISTVLMSPVAVALSWAALPDEFNMSETIIGVRWWYCALAILLRSCVTPGSRSDGGYGHSSTRTVRDDPPTSVALCYSGFHLGENVDVMDSFASDGGIIDVTVGVASKVSPVLGRHSPRVGRISQRT